MPQIFMISGANGAGKTTSAMGLLPKTLNCEEYVNADSIAFGLSPFKPEELAFKAGRLMLNRIHKLSKTGIDFAFETTGASKTFVPFLLECQKKGYYINVIYFWLNNINLALQRIEIRVKNGGHNIPENVVKRRYKKGLINFFNIYTPIADKWFLYDSSNIKPEKIAENIKGHDIIIHNEKLLAKCMGMIK